MKWNRPAGMLLIAALGLVAARADAGPLPRLFGAESSGSPWQKLQAAHQVPLDKLPAGVRDKIREVVERPTLYTQGPQESFTCEPDLYLWFLDNPDRAMTAWQRLGAKVLEIKPRGNGAFGWEDGQGSDVWWHTVYAGQKVRVWYAEGQVKPGKMLPSVPVQCVVILHHDVKERGEHEALMEHQADVFVRTSSRAAALITRMLGPSVPRLAEQGAAQLQMFFAAMAWYCHQHPERAKVLLSTEPVAFPGQNPARAVKYNPLAELP